jgi:hypothetical protein
MIRSVFPNSGIRDCNAQLGQFGLDAPTAPSGIGLPHPVNQTDEVVVGRGSSKAESGFPAPEEAKAKAMPSDDGLGLEKNQGMLPFWPEAQQANP